jgi:DNA modification methylase
MDGNKWIVYAEGVWPEHKYMQTDFAKISKESQSKRWQDLAYTAMGMWPDINETDIMYKNRGQSDFRESEDADKHLCPLPRTIARRAIELYTLPGEVVFTPFMGIGTEADAALRLGRKAIGIELKPEYFMQSIKNIALAVEEDRQVSMWDMLGELA